MCVFYNLVLFYVLVYLYSVAVGASIPLLCSHRVSRSFYSSPVNALRFFSSCIRESDIRKSVENALFVPFVVVVELDNR